MRLAALLVCAKCIAVPLVAACLIRSLVFHDLPMVCRSLVVMGGVLLMIMAQWIVASRANCPLCMTPVLGNKQCNKHRRARKLLGSYRLRVAFQILTQNKFDCPYCSEPTELKVREPRRA